MERFQDLVDPTARDPGGGRDHGRLRFSAFEQDQVGPCLVRTQSE